MRRSKKAQVTVFIILGIILLFSTAFVFYIRQQVAEYKPPIGLIEEVTLELQPIQIFVTDCLERTSIDALQRAGLRGGYTDTSTLKIGISPTESDAVEFSPGGLKVPYWHYMRSSNDCTSKCEFDSKLLPLRGQGRTVKTELEDYVDARLDACIANFAVFEAQGITIAAEEPSTEVIIGANNVHFQLEYPLTITIGTSVSEISGFFVSIPINLEKIYLLAEEITNKEISTDFLEYSLVSLIESFSGIDERRLPPTADTDFGFGSRVFWLKSDVKDMLRDDILIRYVPALQATNTLNYQGNLYKGDDALAQAIHNTFILPLGGIFDLETSFIYLGWPIYFDITPSSGEIIRANSFSTSLLSFLGLNQYTFVYDVSYPAVIEIYDPNALEGKGFTFQFALEANVRNNDAMNPDTQLFAVPPFGGTDVCDPRLFNSGNITITVEDSLTGNPLEDAQVYLSFGTEGCLIGATDENGALLSKFPIGIGTFSVVKEDYLTHSRAYGTSLDKEDSLSVELHQFAEKNIVVKKMQVKKEQFTASTTYATLTFEVFVFDPNPVQLKLTDSVLLTLTRVKEDPTEDDVIAFVDFRGNESFKTMRLAPGRYEIDATFMTYERTVIPEDEICFKTDWYDYIGLGDEECQTIPAITFNPIFPHGGLKIDESAGYFEISPTKLQNSKHIEFYAIEAPAGYTRDASGVTNLKHEDLDQSSEIDEHSRSFRGVLEPVFVNE